MEADWQPLGGAAGTRAVGANHVRVAPGKLPTPPHSHGASEELYFVLAGSGLAWQDGEVHEVRPLDCVIHRPNEMEHTFVAGPDGLEYLVFGTRHPTELGWLPRSRAIRFGWPWGEGRDDDPRDVAAPGGRPRGRRAPSGAASRRHGRRTSSTSTRSRPKPSATRRSPTSRRVMRRSSPASPGRSSRRGTAATPRIAIPPRKRCTSFSTGRRRSSSGTTTAKSRRRRSAPVIS